jgi:hypothetical protein
MDADVKAFALCMACDWKSSLVSESEADELAEEHDRTVHQGLKTAVIAPETYS